MKRVGVKTEPGRLKESAYQDGKVANSHLYATKPVWGRGKQRRAQGGTGQGGDERKNRTGAPISRVRETQNNAQHVEEPGGKQSDRFKGTYFDHPLKGGKKRGAFRKPLKGSN